MPLSQRELDLLDARGRDLEKRSRLLLGADVSGIRGPAAKAAALSGYLSAIEGKVPTSYDDMVKQQKEADARAALEAQAGARAEAAAAARQQKLDDMKAERDWKAQQAALERQSRERMKRQEIKAKPAPRDPVADHLAKKQAENAIKMEKDARVREEGYQKTLREVQRARQVIAKYGNDLFGPYQTSGFNQTIGKFTGSDAQKGRELYQQTMKEMELAAAEAMRGTGAITENERATLRGTVGADVSDQEQALEILKRLEENARARRPLWGAAMEEADDVAE